ncbi:mite allergen Der p 3-like [Pseudomyrmex gracilis]|uniref:mite allergen Der p 3-like n=1 Tax=Pseudomyrmex gracilis TaxID=219809 RepID=UPI00099536AC|nr:mite allergen Der p 3-like [Pseudomyrmex gracilis]
MLVALEMVSSTLLHFGLAFIFLYVTSCASMRTVHTEPSKISITFDKTPVKLNEKTFQVILENSTSGLIFCGGILLKNYYVLTAAECVVNRQADTITAYTGLKEIDVRELHNNKHSIRKIIMHESYDQHNLWRNDIALLKLSPLKIYRNASRNIFAPFTEAVLPLKSKLDKVSKRNHLRAKVFGFGIKKENTPPSSIHLVKSFTYVIDWEYCRQLYKKIHYSISDSHICAYDPYDVLLNTRVSDVGSSLIVSRNVTLGVALSTRGGYLTKNTYFPILFTNISLYRDWIEHVISRTDY